MTFSATPWSVRRRPGATRIVRTPIAAILRGVWTLCVHPNPGVLVHAARPRQPEIGQCLDDDLLQAVHVRRARCRVVGHAHDRVRHQLPRAVVRDVPAPVGSLEHRADLRGIDQDVALVRGAPSV